MNRAQLSQVLRRLTQVPSAAHDELDLRTLVHTLLSENKVHYQTDTAGNTVARLRRGLPRYKVAFIVHLDEPALRVVAKRGNRLTCKPDGVLAASELQKQKFSFPKSGAKAKVASIKATADDAVAEAVLQLLPGTPEPEIGDFAELDVPPFTAKARRAHLRGGSALIGSTALIAALAQLSRQEAACEVWGVFTRAATIGYQGDVALILSGLVPRDLFVISIDCALAGDHVALGGGPVVRLGDAYGPFEPRAVALTSGAARDLAQKKVPHQRAYLDDTPSQAGVFTAFGYRSADIAIPTDGQHLCELDFGDLEGAVSLLMGVAERAGAGTDDLDLVRNDLVRNSEEGRQRLRTPVVGSVELAPEPV